MKREAIDVSNHHVQQCLIHKKETNIEEGYIPGIYNSERQIMGGGHTRKKHMGEEHKEKTCS